MYRGNYPKALTNYERGLVDYNSSSILAAQNPLHRSQCLAGIARMSIRCGDSRKGVGIAMDNESSRLLRKECAEILESMKVYFVRFIYSSLDLDLKKLIISCYSINIYILAI